jgi:RimJ/RimL family protein N-acetyltransferase
MTVTIELLSTRHASALLRLAQDARIAETSSVPVDCTSADVDGWVANNDTKPAVSLTFAILADDVVVGAVTLKRLDAPDHSGELSYWIGTEFQRRGYASAAARLAVEFAFGHVGLSRIDAHFLKQHNPASGAVLRRCGFEPDAHRSDLPTAGRFAEAFPVDHWTFVHLLRPEGNP